MLKRLWNPSTIFVLGQAGVGFLHYIYQVLARQFLSLEDFGAWSVWFAQFAITLLVAMWFQSLATLDGPEQPLFRVLFRPRVAWPLLLASLGSAILAQATSSWSALTAIGWFWAGYQGVVFGRSLARGRLVLITFVMTAGALAKLAVPVIAHVMGAAPEIVRDAAYAGILWGPLAGLVIAFALDLEPGGPTGVGALGFRFKVFGTSFLLAAITAAAPQFDLLVAGHLLGPEDLGRFGSVALVYKAFFFLILIFAQLLISRQVRAGGGTTRPLVFLPVIGVGLMLAAGAVLIFPPGIAPPLWVAYGCLHISTLTFLFLVTQTEVSRGEWRTAAIVLALWCLQFGVSWFFTPTLDVFYQGCLLTDALLILSLLFRKSGSAAGTRGA